VAFDPLPYAAPVFALALLIEGWAIGGYSRRAVVSALGCVALDQITAAWGLVLFVTTFEAVHRTLGPVSLSARSPWTWVLAVLAHDFAYYAYHRASHRVNVLWAAHVVHHQSERYDFTVSLRQGALATWITYAFYLPLALLVDAQVFLVVHAAYQIYQFFVHTRAIGRLGPLEAVFATPSHHRVHHGSERRHLDTNYGGFFIVFDRLLGTFVPEQGEPRYGVPGGYDVVSPLFANTYMMGRLIAATRTATTGRARLRLWFGPPEASTYAMSSAGHAPRAVEHASIIGTWLPLVAAGVGTLTLVFVDLPISMAVVIGGACVVLLELASAPLDGRTR